VFCSAWAAAFPPLLIFAYHPLKILKGQRRLSSGSGTWHFPEATM